MAKGQKLCSSVPNRNNNKGFFLSLLISSALFSNAAQAGSLTQYGITWTFLGDPPTGQFANGDYWVVGPVTITNIFPKTARPGSQESDTVGNGSMINPIPGQTQGLYRHGTDSEPGNSPKYVDSKNISLQLPYTVAPGNSVYSTDKNPDTWAPEPNFEGTWFRETAVLTVLGSVPPAGSFRPPYAGTDKTIKANWNVSSMNYSALRNLAIPIPSNAPTMAWLEEATKRPLMEMNYNWINTNWKASWRIGKPGGFPGRDYGREVAGVSGGAGLMLNTNLSNAQKEKLLIYMVQWGIDIYGLLNAGMEWQPNGGHNHGRLLPIYIAGKVLGDPQILAKASGTSPFQEMSNHFLVTQEIIDLSRSPSDPPRKPYTDMLDMPEWCHAGPLDPNNSSAWDNTSDPNFYASGYRYINGSPNTATVATILLMGGRSEVNKEAFFRYHIERYYPKERPTGNGAFTGNSNGIEAFTRDMWDAHIDGNSFPPPPPPPPPPPVVIPPLTTTFMVGDRIHVWRPTWVNSTPSVTTPIGPQQVTGAKGSILEGPNNSGNDGITWFRMLYDNGATGWSGADNFVKDNSVAVVAAVAISPNGGSFSSAQNVSLSSATSGTEIRYTVDGSVPTASSLLYTNPILVGSTQTLKAIALKSGMTTSAVSSASFTITLPPPPPPTVGVVASVAISPADGTYSSMQTVSMSSATAGAQIRYTLDGTDPTATSTLYTAVFTLSSSKSIKAIAIKSGMTTSAISTRMITIKKSPPKGLRIVY